MRDGRSLVELAISLCVIFILLGVFFGYAGKVLLAAREIALLWELRNLRLSLQLFRILNEGRTPERLSELYKGGYHVSIDRFDRRGNLLDPFGSPYLYSPSTGCIRAASLKYVDW